MAVAIKVENLSKIYQLGEMGTGTISKDIDRWFKTKILGKEDPFLKIGETNYRSLKGESDIVYSLRDINFEIQQGDAVGIIGRNGAGKSTLLKILSRVTSPTTGRVQIKGRVASLLEVGTGFHPELTGLENIYLNGAILGMRRQEITRKLDEIIDFSGVERFIDTPVKRYSSGMYVRLAFAVAAHLESEILIVDEVLAVGDAEFQKKCLGKMGEVSKGEGRTVLFVSHNMASVKSMCRNGIILSQGFISKFGKIDESILHYEKQEQLGILDRLHFEKISLEQHKPIELLSVYAITIEDKTIVRVKYVVRKNINCVLAVKILNNLDVAILTIHDTDLNFDAFKKIIGTYSVEFLVPIYLLSFGAYKITVSLADMKSERFDFLQDVVQFTLQPRQKQLPFSDLREGILRPSADYVLVHPSA
jgi:lipopolysaccharide transport system ATP-binding protein